MPVNNHLEQPNAREFNPDPAGFFTRVSLECATAQFECQ